MLDWESAHGNVDAIALLQMISLSLSMFPPLSLPSATSKMSIISESHVLHYIFVFSSSWQRDDSERGAFNRQALDLAIARHHR